MVVASDPPASYKPVEHTLSASTSTGHTESNLEIVTQVEPVPTPPMDMNSPSVTGTTIHSMDAFPNLDQYFEHSPPHESSSSSRHPNFRVPPPSPPASGPNGLGGVQKKNKPSPASQTSLAAGARTQTHPQAVMGSRRRSIQPNQFRVLTDDLDGQRTKITTINVQGLHGSESRTLLFKCKEG